MLLRYYVVKLKDTDEKEYGYMFKIKIGHREIENGTTREHVCLCQSAVVYRQCKQI